MKGMNDQEELVKRLEVEKATRVIMRMATRARLCRAEKKVISCNNCKHLDSCDIQEKYKAAYEVKNKNFNL